MLGALLTGATHYLERYMHPFFLLTPLWLIGLVETSGNASRRLAVLATVLVAVTLIVVPIRLRDALHAMGPECRKCRIAVPYDGLAAALEAQGFKTGTLIAADRHDAGNLRRFFPEARIVRVERPAYAPPIRASGPHIEGRRGVAQRVGEAAAQGRQERVRQDRGQSRRHARTRGRSLAALSAGIGRAKVDLGDRGRRSQAISIGLEICFLVIET